MTRHRVFVLGGVAALALMAGLWSSQTRRSDEPPLMQAVVPGLEAGINAITEVRIRTAGDALQATIRRGESGWSVAERGDWPADVDALRTYLLKLAQAKRVEAKTSSPALYEKLGVESVDAATAGGVQLEIDGLAQPVKLIVGRNVVRGSGSYMRYAGDAQSWQTDTDLAVEKSTANWLRRELVDIAAGRVTQVEVVPPAGPKIAIVRAAAGGSGDFSLANLPKGRELASEYVADATAGFLAGLRFDDVLDAAGHEEPASGAVHATFATEDGIGITVSAWKDGEQARNQFAATLDEAVAARFVEQAQAKAVREHEALKTATAADPASVPASGASGPGRDGAPASSAGDSPDVATKEQAAPLAVTDPAKDRDQRLAALRAEVDSLNARFKGKTFVLPAFKADNLHKALESYLKPKA